MRWLKIRLMNCFFFEEWQQLYMWSPKEPFRKWWIYFILYVHFKARQEPLTAPGKGKSFIFNIEEINFIWKKAIAMQHSSGNRCFRGGKIHSENVIHRSDMSNTWSDQLILTPLETEQIPQSLRTIVPFCLSESPWSLWTKIPVNIFIKLIMNEHFNSLWHGFLPLLVG